MEIEKHKKITITLPEDLIEDYKEFTKDNGFNLSGRIAILIKGDLKNKIIK